MQSCVGMQGDCSLLAVAAMRCATGAAEKPSDKPEQWHLLGAKVAIDGKQPLIAKTSYTTQAGYTQTCMA